MKIKLHTEKHFDSAHYLDGYKGKCKEMHGHRWVVKVEVEGIEVDSAGILWDFKNLGKILEKYDHKCLNDLDDFHGVNPTAENIAKVILKQLKEKHPKLHFSVRVHETPESWCEVRK